MPTEIIHDSDAITDMVRFRTSAVYEMLVSLHTLLTRRRHQEWAAQTLAALPEDFWPELVRLYTPLNQGVLLFELAVDYLQHEDVPGFIAYIRAMQTEVFIFYLLGRILTVAQIAETRLNPRVLLDTLHQSGDPYFVSHLADLPWLEILSDVQAYQARLANLWERYWRQYFHTQLEGLPERWAGAITEGRYSLTRLGGRGLLELLTGNFGLPRTLPEGKPVTEILFIPLYYISVHSYMFFGYGSVTVLFNCERTEMQIVEERRRKEETVEILKALGDSTRLGILRLIAQSEGKLNGKKIAAKLHLSPSAVSRQLAQLRDSGLIIDEPQDDQSVIYRLAKDKLASLSDQVMEYLYS